MIFLTVGTHEPFDRLVRCVDDWCAATGRGDQVFGQITRNAGYTPRHFDSVPDLTPTEYQDRFRGSDFVVSHAGMGSIITALTLGKPIVILPRRGHLQETRNDHQFATFQQFQGREGILAARTEGELPALLARAEGGQPGGGAEISRFADDRLIGAVRSFIFTA